MNSSSLASKLAGLRYVHRQFIYSNRSKADVDRILSVEGEDVEIFL